MKYKIEIVSLLMILSLFQFCKKDDPITDPETKTGNLQLSFNHKVNGNPLTVDTLLYINTAGNEYMVNEIQYFISDIVLHSSTGNDYSISANNGIHYIDTDIPATQVWSIPENIPVGNYTSVSFTFGINQAKNQSGIFVNPPEVDMFWPEFLGGGYHYMKLNGKWKDTNSDIVPFNFHLGIGQIYAGNVIVIDSITGFVQNYFTVQLPASALSISENTVTKASITMNVDSWFDTPHVWDFDAIGSNIMQNQPAMQMAKENGADVFTFLLN
jgi:hypothetical protein